MSQNTTLPTTDPKPPADAPRVDLDVRPILREGGEPFSVIMEHVTQLQPDEVFRLATTFDPIPLHTVLSARGFEHHTTRISSNDFVTEYWAPKAPVKTATPPSTESANTDSKIATTIDVRGLLPPEPMEQTLLALEELADGERLRQINERVPAFLLPLLDDRGYRYAVDDQGDKVVVDIWRKR